MANEQLGDRAIEPNTLWHYTTIQALIRMVEKDRIRATRADLLNDVRELHFGIDIIMEYAKSKVPTDGCDLSVSELEEFDFCHSISYIYENVNQKGTFVACLTTEADSLSQWYMYANKGRGVAIGFSLNDLKQRLRKQMSGEGPGYDMIDKVTYWSVSEAKKECASIVEQWKTLYDSANCNVIRAAIKLVLLTKHEAFRCEKEWRILAANQGQNSSDFTSNCYPNDVPFPDEFGENKYLYLPVVSESNVAPYVPIESIKLGPGFTGDERKQLMITLDKFMTKHGHSLVPITESEIPYRSG